MNKKQGFAVIAGIILCVASICLFAGWIFFNPPFTWGLPNYVMEQTDSTHEGYRRTTLAYGNTVYVNDYEEAALITFGDLPTQMIGRLPAGEGANGIYAIPGQDPSAYVLEYDPMYQAVYRNTAHPPFDWRTAEFQTMRLMFPAANPKESGNANLIGEVLSALQSGNPKVVAMQSNGSYSGVKNYQLVLFSNELPGMAYVAGVHVAEDGRVFLAENIGANEWFEAGNLFSDWAVSP